MSGTSQVIRANSRDLPLADDSVDLVVTSPPYFALRSYQDGGEHYAGQIGDEPTPAEFVDSLLEVTRECVRVLKPSGSLWVNLGDKYNSAGGHTSQGETSQRQGRKSAKHWVGRPSSSLSSVRTKSLVGIPWRYALRCIDDLGLILRAEVIWSKPNGLPESVTDRVRRSHETWFHFTLEPRYFSAVDEIREAAQERARAMTWAERKAAGEPARRGEQGANDATVNGMAPNPLGKLPGSVWTIPTQPLKVPDHLGVDHFAAFPMEWPRRIIRAWSPEAVCVTCGQGRASAKGHCEPCGRSWDNCTPSDSAMCCPTRPAVVLDPFGGTGTTALVAKAWGRHGISVDMSADYCRLAEWRTNDEGELARAMQVDKPAEQVKGQADLFDLIEGGAA